MAINKGNTDTNASLTVEQKFAKVMLHLRSIRPFYSAVYEVMEKKEVSSIDTMGVTANELLYNEKFVDKTNFSEFVFINLHEIAHTALQHVARVENRDRLLWNVAADLYVNAVLADEFGLKPGNTVNINGIEISMPADGLYCSSVDTEKDYVEKIYESFEQQANKNGYMQAASRNKLGQGSQQDGQDPSKFGYTFKYTGSKHEDSYYGHNKTDNFQVTIMPNQSMDLVNNGEDAEMTKQKADKVVSDALVRVEMSSQRAGSGAGGLMSIVKEMRKSLLDWRKLLRKYLIEATSCDSSFSRPDKRMYYQRSIYPGQVANESDSIKGIKVCIDTSGSISDTDIEYFCGQVYDITKQFKIEAELIYWDAAIQTTGEFKGYKEFKRVNIMGRGGTDPKVVFDYFDSKKCKVKPVVTLMFTDAWFDTDKITSKQRRKYKDTIWIMTKDHFKDFTPPFGRKAVTKFL